MQATVLFYHFFRISVEISPFFPERSGGKEKKRGEREKERGKRKRVEGRKENGSCSHIFMALPPLQQKMPLPTKKAL
jgi:Ser-tRNA(Ala) deacylase AlaX